MGTGCLHTPFSAHPDHLSSSNTPCRHHRFISATEHCRISRTHPSLAASKGGRSIICFWPLTVQVNAIKGVHQLSDYDAARSVRASLTLECELNPGSTRKRTQHHSFARSKVTPAMKCLSLLICRFRHDSVIWPSPGHSPLSDFIVDYRPQGQARIEFTELLDRLQNCWPSPTFIVACIVACRINSCCTFIGAPVSSSHERYVWLNVCQPIRPYLPAEEMKHVARRGRLLPMHVGRSGFGLIKTLEGGNLFATAS